VRFLATHDSQERIIAKYREKLESKARREGLKDISELKSAYKDKIESLRKEAATPGVTAPLKPIPTSTPTSTSTSPFPPPPPPPAPAAATATSTTPSPPKSDSTSARPPPGVKTLASFLDVEKIKILPQPEIQALWRLRHASNPSSIHFTLPASTFRNLLATAKQHPNFVLPVPRQVPQNDNSATPAQQPAAELHYLQFSHPYTHTTTLIFTTLYEFQMQGEFATPHTTISFHSELADSHDLVMGQGTVMSGRGVTVDEARWLVMCMQKFYVVEAGEAQERRQMLEMFTRGDGGFNVEKLLEEAEKIV
jgi:ATP synthase F1 complex assembly factor 1